MSCLNIRLIVTDMDGTLLDGERRLPRDFPQTVHTLAAHGIAWAIASGRQFANLRAQFDALGLRPDIIAENGALAVAGGASHPFFQDLTPAAFFDDVLNAALTIAGATPVLCGAERAWVHAAYPENFVEVGYYFSETALWGHPEEICGLDVCKVAIYHPDAAGVLWPVLSPLANAERRVILSSPHWIDVQPARINKGNALSALLSRRDLRPEQAIVFGDYLNDAEMMTLGTHAVAMGNAHPDLKALCAHVTRPNTENGVMWYLKEVGLLK